MSKYKKKKNIKIFWIGPYINSAYYHLWKAASPAAIKWQKYLIEQLNHLGINIEWLYYRPEPYWPKGRLFPSNVKILSKLKVSNQQIKYVNFIGLRNLSIRFFLMRLLMQSLKKSDNSQSFFLVSYNCTKWIKKTFSNNKIKSNFKKIYVAADEQVNDGADGYIFLSYYYFKKFKFNQKLHLDGAIYSHNKKKFNYKKKNKKVFFYSGSMHKWGGVNTLIKALKLIKRKDLEVWISGPGDRKDIEIAALNDNRIKILGLLNDRQLSKCYNYADIFLNPRPVKMYGNELNFPSKLFDYLAWQKPIISTWTKGLSPEYRNVLHTFKDTPSDLAKAMLSYFNYKKVNKKKNKDFYQIKNWKMQGKRFIFFLKYILKKKNEKN